MNVKWKELLLNLGTPVIETLIADEIGDVVVFQKSGGEFIVIESSGVIPSHAVYDSEEDIKREFPEYELVKVTDEIYYLLKEVPENFEEIVNIEKLSEKIKSVERLENRITRHIYQLEGMDTIISSLLEPLPMDILLSMIIDAISELFVASSALYELTDEGYSLVMNIGAKDFPEVVKSSDISDAAKVSYMMDAEKVSGIDGLIIPISDNMVNKYLIFLRRDDPFTPEEKALLTSIMKILNKSREAFRSKEKEIFLGKMLNQMRFVMESLGEYAVRSLSIHDEDELINMTVDMIREMLQATWSVVYEFDGEDLLLKSLASIREIDVPAVLSVEVKDEIWKPGKIEGFPEFVWLSIPISFGKNRKLVIFVGSPITEDFLNEEIRDLYIEIISRMIKESFENFEYERELIEREKNIRRLYESITAIGEFSKELRKIDSPGEVYDLVYKYAAENVGVNGMEVFFRGVSVEMGEKTGEEFFIETDDGGKMKFYKRDGFSSTDKAVLKVLAEGASTILKDIYLMVPSEKMLWMDDIKLRYLREKAKRHEIPEENMRFYIIKGSDDIEKLSEIGVGIISHGEVVVATDKSREDLEKMGFEVEEI